MTEIAARLSRPIRSLGRLSAVALALSLLVVVGGGAVFARALSLQDSVLPGVSVAGIDVGGLTREDARIRVERALATRMATPIAVAVGERGFAARPDRLWAFDAAATEERAFQAGRRSLLSRLGALVAPFAFERDVAPVVHLRPAEEASVSKRLRQLTRRPADARVRVAAVEPVVVPGREGTAVAEDAFYRSLETAMLAGATELVARVDVVPPAITTLEAEAVAQRARTIVAAPVGIDFKGRRVGELGPKRLARLIRFEVVGGSIGVTLDEERLGRVLGPFVQAKTRKPVDARFKVVGKRVRVIRAKAGTTLSTAEARDSVLAAALEPGVRVAPVVLAKLQPDFTTREARALGIRRQISTFTTDMGASSSNRIWNVQLLGRYLDGTILKPGQVFSYNKVMGPRTVERGFREGQMIFGGVLIPSIGGGVCQTATTIFNAAFEAGLPIKERHNHSFYISHYPTGRDATVSWGGPDLVFRNDLDHAILIKVAYTNSTFTVSFYGTKQRRKVVASTSTPTNYTSPRLQYAVDPGAPRGSVRHAAGGGPGFDVNVHRKVFERGKLIREDDFFTRYVPQNPTAIYGPGRTPPGPFFYLPSSG